MHRRGLDVTFRRRNRHWEGGVAGEVDAISRAETGPVFDRFAPPEVRQNALLDVPGPTPAPLVDLTPVVPDPSKREAACQYGHLHRPTAAEHFTLSAFV